MKKMVASAETSTEVLERLNDEVLVERFSLTAKRLGSAVLDSDDRRANRAAHRIIAVRDALRARGRESTMKLVPLLDDKDRFVRYYAAQQLLGLVPDRARAVIEWNAKFGFDALAGDAGMMLLDLDRGFYKPDQK